MKTAELRSSDFTENSLGGQTDESPVLFLTRNASKQGSPFVDHSNTSTEPDKSTGSILPTHPNLRCLGGLIAQDGRRVRRGIFLRAPVLRALDATADAALAGLDLALIVDFRQPHEAATAPVSFAADRGVRRMSLPIRTGASMRVMASNPEAILEDAVAAAVMIEVYRDFVRLNADVYGAFLRAIAAAPGPALFHCTAGKDRTGFAAGLILATLGVPMPVIMTDYMATAALWQPDADLVAHIAPAARAAVLGVRPAYLTAAFDEMDRLHGGACTFARDVLGKAALDQWIHRSLI